MSRLEELIKELCPDGVEYVPLGTKVTFLNGRAYKQTELLDTGKYKVLRVGNFHTNDKWYYSDLELDDNKYCVAGDLLYTWAATIGPEIWNGEKVIFHYHIWKLKFDENILNKKFLYHFLKMDIDNISKSLTNSTMPHVSMASMEKRLVPVPPLPIQQEIVRILDSFTELTAELTAELEARKKQYQYYRNNLVKFDDTVTSKKLEDVCLISAGGDAPRDSISNEKSEKYSIPIISNGIGENAFYGYTDYPRITVPAVTVAARGTIGYAEYRDYPYFPIVRLLSVIPKDSSVLNTRYLLYCLQGKQYNIPTSGIPQLTAPMLKNVEIPIPPIKEQERIVSILDKFERLCTSLQTGLPAEINARKMQYEFFRDKLLDFKKVELAI